MDIIDLAQERRAQHDRREGRARGQAEALTAALEGGEIEVLFQPQFASANGRLVGAEALARWQHPQLGRIGAQDLFADAECAGLAGALAHHVARAALRAAAAWPAGLQLSLNVTAADLAAEDFPERMSAHIAEAGFPPERLTLEITEESLVDDVVRSAGRLQPMAARGIRIALDDFGAGFCNFRYLKQLPLNGLKLDRSMVEGIDEDPRDLAVLRGIVAMARALGLEVTAEGIERQGQLDAVVREGCAYWQGFLASPPIDAAEFVAMAKGAMPPLAVSQPS